MIYRTVPEYNAVQDKSSQVDKGQTRVMTEIRASGIREQDVDLLLWEELVASPDFLSSFLKDAGLSDRGDLAAVARSVTS